MFESLEGIGQPFTNLHAVALGITRQRLRQLVDQGQLRRVLRGVYSPEWVPDSIENRIRAAALVVPPYAVLCDRTAAWVHDVDVLRYRELEIPPPLDIVVQRGFVPSRRQDWRNGERDFAPEDVIDISGLRVTSPLRTALDLGCKLPRRDALAALDQFARRFGFDPCDLAQELPRFRGRRGVIQLRGLVPLVDGDSESPGESKVRLALLDAGMPKPTLQFEILVDGMVRYRLDHAYPKHKVCVEYDGDEAHGTPEQQAADQIRRDWLRAQGWTVVVVRKEDLTADAIQRWTELVRARLLTKTRWPRG